MLTQKLNLNLGSRLLQLILSLIFGEHICIGGTLRWVEHTENSLLHGKCFGDIKLYSY